MYKIMLKWTKSHIFLKCITDGEYVQQRNFTRYENCPGRPGVSVYTVQNKHEKTVKNKREETVKNKREKTVKNKLENTVKNIREKIV